MAQEIGYADPLYILAYDHRGTLIKGMFGVEGEPDAEVSQKISEFKRVIYNGFLMAVEKGIPKEYAGILVDEQFGSEVLIDARKDGFIIILGVEKSGQKEFSFEFGEGFGEHIEKFNPQIVKALVRYNPEDDHEMNMRQLSTLKTLADYCHEHARKFLIEPLIAPTEAELASYGGDKAKYDAELRPRLEVDMIKQMQDGGVEVDIWKIEGLNKKEHYEAVANQARSGGRNNVAVVVLGRGAGEAEVDGWLLAGKDVSGVTGFAIGRTIFWDPLMELKEGKITPEQASEQICERYMHFYKVFTDK